ncbi:hypothetical protein C9374_000652 [Naegleria lovaniensis]|uniref:Uncharacterized protein n=1 Tax=Naegleria lovaniensis TaxID=51637 RepID=A0AA88GY34_NAELO|nr:uncharacterized protein C9374_000652 [Naegleria lovaniensis]KAG2388488.1 hypothetical protein C9374_000652 [Naegleria lovaniensis]
MSEFNNNNFHEQQDNTILTSQTPKRKRNTSKQEAKNVRKKQDTHDEDSMIHSASTTTESTVHDDVQSISSNNHQQDSKTETTENTSSIDLLLKENLSTTDRLLTLETMFKIVRKKVELFNKQQEEGNNQTTTQDDTTHSFVLGMIENQIRQRLVIAKQKGLAVLPEALISKLCDIFSIATCYLWKVEEKQQFLVNAFGNNYSTGLREILKRFYIPLENDPILTKQSTFNFLEPEEIDNAEERDRLREEQQQVISTMMASKNTANHQEQSKEEYDASLLELLNKHQEKYKSRQSRFLTGLANPKEFLKEADLFRQQRLKRDESQRKQQQELLERKKMAHASTIKVDKLPDNRFTSGIKVKNKKKKKL